MPCTLSQGENICTHTDRASTLLNQRQSPLLRLPAELRNRIYEYTLGGNTILINPWFGKPRFRITVCDFLGASRLPRGFDCSVPANSRGSTVRAVRAQLLPFAC
jgi:hypothetical protein